MEFKDRLKQLREEKGLTQYQLADRLFVSRSAIAKWEQGRGMPSEETLKSLAAFFGLSPEDVLPRDELYLQAARSLKRERFWKIFGLGFLGVAFLVGGTWGGIALAKKKEAAERFDRFQENGFYDEAILSSYHLEGLSAPTPDQGTAALFRHDELSLSLSSEADAENYAHYLYQSLRSNPYISYLSFATNLPSDSGTASTSDQLFPLEEFRDCESVNNAASSHVYEFYFFPDFDQNHVSGSFVSPSCLFFSWSSRFSAYANAETQKTYPFNAVFRLSTCSYSGKRFTLGSETGKLSRIKLTPANYAGYFKPYFGSEGNPSKKTFEWIYAQDPNRVCRRHFSYTVTLSYGSDGVTYPYKGEWSGKEETFGGDYIVLDGIPDSHYFVRLDEVRFTDDSAIAVVG